MLRSGLEMSLHQLRCVQQAKLQMKQRNRKNLRENIGGGLATHIEEKLGEVVILGLTKID